MLLGLDLVSKRRKGVVACFKSCRRLLKGYYAYIQTKSSMKGLKDVAQY